MFPLAPGGPSTPATPCERQVNIDPCYLKCIFFLYRNNVADTVDKGDGTYRRSRGSRRTARSQQTSRTLWRMRSNASCCMIWTMMNHCPLVDTFVKATSDIRRRMNRVLLLYVGITYVWDVLTAVLHSRQLIPWARSLRPRPTGRERHKSESPLQRFWVLWPVISTNTICS